MLYRILTLCVLTLASYTNADYLLAGSIDSAWLGCVPSDRFAPLTLHSPKTLPGYDEQLIPYLAARGVHDEASMEAFVREDLLHMAEAFSILFEQDSNTILHRMLGEHSSLIEGHSTQIDHVGRELFGPISFYLPILEHIAPELGVEQVRQLLFPSTQVVKVLQEQDPTVKGVTIGRIYFQSLDGGDIKSLELFQASPQDGSSPQNIAATKERLALLTGFESHSSSAPIDHLSVELSTVEEVHNIHQRIHQLASDTLRPYQKEVSYNPGDGSTQTKAAMRDSTEAPFNRIVEFVHYGDAVKN